MQIYLKSVEWTNRLLADRIRGGRILDVGGAEYAGRANFLVQKGLDVSLLDPAPIQGELCPGILHYRKPAEDLNEEDGLFDHIILSNVLEHVADPSRVLCSCAAHLSENGRLHLLVPNCESVNRRIGVAMGILSSIREIPEKEIAIGHRHTFSVADIKQLIQSCGLAVNECFGTLFKPVPTPEMMQWSEQRILACFEIAPSLPPEICHEIYFQVL